MNKKELIDAIKSYKITNARNSMGCLEDWYDFTFAMKATFSVDEIEKMSEHDIELLHRLHESVSEGFY